MTELVLFSLDTLVNLPRLYTDAIERVFDGTEPRESILERLADCGMNPYQVIENIVASHHAPEYGRMPSQGPTSDFVLQDLALSKETYPRTQAFKQTVQETADACVKNNASELLVALQNRKTGIFYMMGDNMVKRIVQQSGLSVDIVAGYTGSDSETPYVTTKAVVQHAMQLVGVEHVWIVGNHIFPRDHEALTKSVDVKYIACNETSEAPLARVTAVMEGHL